MRYISKCANRKLLYSYHTSQLAHGKASYQSRGIVYLLRCIPSIYFKLFLNRHIYLYMFTIITLSSILIEVIFALTHNQ